MRELFPVSVLPSPESLFADGSLEVRSENGPARIILPLLRLPDPPPPAFRFEFSVEGNSPKAKDIQVVFRLLFADTDVPARDLSAGIFANHPLPGRPGKSSSLMPSHLRLGFASDVLHVGTTATGLPIFETKTGVRDRAPDQMIDWQAGRQIWLCLEAKESFRIRDLRYLSGTLPDASAKN